MPTVVRQENVTKKLNKSAVSRIESVNFNSDKGIKLLLYGRSGTGKTRTWSTFPGPILCLVCSGGKGSGELRSVSLDNRKKIKKVDIERTTDVRELIDYQSDEEKFKTFVLDHASGLQGLVLKEVLGLNEIPQTTDWGIADQRDWGQVNTQMIENLYRLLSLKCNVVIVAQQRESGVDDDNDVVVQDIGPGLTPGVAKWLTPSVDYCGQTYIRKKTSKKKIMIGKKEKIVENVIKGEFDYCLRTGTHDVFYTKFRVPGEGKLVESIVNPNYDKIMSLINGEGE